jgi:hypothetical protein
MAMLIPVLSGCSTVTIKDDEFCADKGTLGAACSTMLTDTVREIPKNVWDNYRFGMLCETDSVFSDLKTDLEETCSKCNCCSNETKAALKTASVLFNYAFLKVKKLKAYKMRGAE